MKNIDLSRFQEALSEKLDMLEDGRFKIEIAYRQQYQYRFLFCIFILIALIAFPFCYEQFTSKMYFGLVVFALLDIAIFWYIEFLFYKKTQKKYLLLVDNFVFKALCEASEKVEFVPLLSKELKNYIFQHLQKWVLTESKTKIIAPIYAENAEGINSQGWLFSFGNGELYFKNKNFYFSYQILKVPMDKILNSPNLNIFIKKNHAVNRQYFYLKEENIIFSLEYNIFHNYDLHFYKSLKDKAFLTTLKQKFDSNIDIFEELIAVF